MPERDPRHPEYRKMDEKLEDVGVFDDLDFEDFFKHLKQDFNITLDQQSAILEIGSGKGALLKKLMTEGYFVTGVEPRKRPEHERGELSMLHDSVEDLSRMHNAKYDLVVASSLIDPKIYDHSPEKIVTNIFRLLKPGGVFLYGLKGASKLPELVVTLGVGKLLESRGDGLNSAYVFQKQ